MKYEPELFSSGVQLLGKGKECNKMGKKGTTMEFFNWKEPRGANKYPQYTVVYSEYTDVYSRVYGRILRYWSLEYTAVYPKSPEWGIFEHNIDHHNWQTRGIPQPTYACIVHYTFVPTCTCHIPLSPKTPFFTRILPGKPGMPGDAHHKGRSECNTIRALGEWASTQFSHSAVTVPVTQSLRF